MAQTRATSKAMRIPLSWVMVLAGYSPTPAEEMTEDMVQSKPPLKTGKGQGEKREKEASADTTPSPTPDPDKIKWIKAYLKKMNADEQDFKQWLAINYGKRNMVGMYRGNLSFRKGSPDGINHLHKRMESGTIDGKEYRGYFDRYLQHKKQEANDT